jgi:hypothetical protein
MKEKTGVLPTLAAVASELGRRGNQGALDAIVATGIAPNDAPSYAARRACDSRRISSISCATDNCKNTVQHTDRHCNRCHKPVPRKLKAEFCIGIGGMVCGRKIERVNQCYKCYDHPEAKKMREAKKAARPKCSIYGCGGNEVRSYGLGIKHYRKRVEDAKAKMKVATDGNF